MRALLIALVLAGVAPWRVAAAQPVPGLEPAQPPATEPGPAPIVEEVPDRAIAQRLRGIFAEVDDLRGVEVEVASGVVHLRGEASSERVREKAEELALRMPGVVYVDNDLETVTAVGDRLEPTVGRLEERLRSMVRALPLLGVAAGIVVLFWLLARLVRAVDLPFRIVSRQRLIRGIVRQVVATVIVVIGLILALELLEATALVGAVLGAAGVIGLALGFAFRDIGENYLASVMLGVRQPFAAGDLILVEGHEGKVVRLTTRDTILMTLDGNHVRLPNAMVYKSVIVNFTRNPLRRFDTTVGVGPGEDLTEAQHIGVHALQRTPGVVDDPPPFARVEELGDFNVLVRYFAWVDQRETDWHKVRSEGIRRVKAALDRAGVAMPVPTQRLEITRHGRPAPAAAEPLEEAAHEVEVDHHLDRQIQDERESDDERDLLRS